MEELLYSLNQFELIAVRDLLAAAVKKDEEMPEGLKLPELTTALEKLDVRKGKRN